MGFHLSEFRLKGSVAMVVNSCGKVFLHKIEGEIFDKAKKIGFSFV